MEFVEMVDLTDFLDTLDLVELTDFSVLVNSMWIPLKGPLSYFVRK